MLLMLLLRGPVAPHLLDRRGVEVLLEEAEPGNGVEDALRGEPQVRERRNSRLEKVCGGLEQKTASSWQTASLCLGVRFGADGHASGEEVRDGADEGGSRDSGEHHA
jgi:hypothetical protein